MMTLDVRPTTSQEEQGHPRRWGILGVMSLSIFMLTVDNTIVNTALPSISRDLRTSTEQMQWIVDGYILMLAGLLLVGGAIGDIYGRRRWFAVGMGVFGLASVGGALSSSAEQLIAFRALQGVGGALVMPATLSIITNAFSRGERAKAIGVWTAVGGLAMGLGPSLGGYLVDHTNWAMVFWVHVPVVVTALVGLMIVPESRDARPRHLDVPGALVGTTALTGFVYGIIAAGERGWTDSHVPSALALAGVAMIAFAAIEARSAAPMLPLHFFRRRDFTAGVLIIGVVFFGIATVFFFLTQYYQLVQGRSAFEAGLLTLPAACAMMVGAPLSGMLVQRTGPKVLITSATAVAALALALLSQLAADTSTLQIAGNLALFGLAGGLGMVPLTDMVMAAVPIEDAGVGSALNDVSREVGAALGIAGVGSLVSSMYRSEVESVLGTTVPPGVIESVGDGIGVATMVAQSLTAELQSIVLAAARTSFVEAFTAGFMANAVLLGVVTVAAAVLVPRRMRTHQVEEPPTGEAALQETAELVPEPELLVV